MGEAWKAALDLADGGEEDEPGEGGEGDGGKEPLGLVVERIKDVAQGEGDLTKRIEVQNDDELGELSRWFNTFMDKLQDIISQGGLVAYVKQQLAARAEASLPTSQGQSQ